MSSLRPLLLVVACLVGLATGAFASGFSALARVDGAASHVGDAGEGVSIDLVLSQPVPWRAYTLDAPRRLVLDFSEVTWDGALEEESARIDAIRTGPFGPG